MSPLDPLLVALMLLFAAGGYRQGFLVGAFSFTGFISGALLGLHVGPAAADRLQDPGGRVLVALLLVFGLAVLGQALAGWVGTRLRGTIRSRSGRRVDDVGGAVVAVLAVVLVAGMVAGPLASSSLPWLARSVRDSAVLHHIDRLTPQLLRDLSRTLRDVVDTRGFPDVFAGLTPTRVPEVGPPDPTIADLPAVLAVAGSVVKVYGDAPACSRRMEGSGFVYEPGYVMTNAHVVAGTGAVTVEAGGGRYDAGVVLFDSDLDVAVLHVPGLDLPAMSFASAPADRGADAIVLGYPLDGPFDAQEARVRELRDISGPDIYGSRHVTREVYSIRALVRGGNSGGPLVAPSGEVLGVIFAAAADDPNTGFALSARQVEEAAEAGAGRTRLTGTGSCA
ncbi:MAG TPA: MarP family serine protease [Natronosporangium sp.]|nr:MarP family serine protease [Natronosporangium sp.]